MSDSVTPVEGGTENDEDTWEYGFYDSDTGPSQIYWYVFGFLTHGTAESAMHTGLKSTWGTPMIVRRRPGSSEWETVDE